MPRKWIPVEKAILFMNRERIALRYDPKKERLEFGVHARQKADLHVALDRILKDMYRDNPQDKPALNNQAPIKAGTKLWVHLFPIPYKAYQKLNRFLGREFAIQATNSFGRMMR